MRIVYFGTAQFAVPPLLALLADKGRFDVVAVVTQPDKPAGRAGDVTAAPVAAAARAAGLPLLQPAKVRTPEFREELAALEADVFVVAAYGRIIPKAVLDLPSQGCFNLHGSLLPKYRGATPIQAAIAAGEAETGVTLMGVDEEVDHGPMYATATVAIKPTDTYATMEGKLAEAAAKLLVEWLPDAASGALPPVEQDHAAATFTTVIDRQDGFVGWNEAATALECRLRAYTPWPGLYAVWRRPGKTDAPPLRLKLLALSVTDAPASGEAAAGTPGATFRTKDGFPAVVTAKGAVKLLHVQPEGKKPMDGKSFMNGYQDFVGSALEHAEPAQ